MPRRALVIVNRKSRGGAGDIGPALDVLRAEGLEVAMPDHLPPPEGLSDFIIDRAKGCDLVVVGGGDGTLNAALEGLLALGIPLGVLPLGTGNDFARTLGLPTNPVEAAGVIARGARRRVDLGVVNGKHFLNVASLGLSVRITDSLSHETKRRWGRLGYVLEAARAISSQRPFIARVTCDGQKTVLRTIQLAVGNGRHYGGGMTVSETAAIDDGWLDLYAMAPVGLCRALGLAPRFRSGRHGRSAAVATLRGHVVDVATDRRMPVDTDGELTTFTPARFRIRPQCLSVYCPEPEN